MTCPRPPDIQASDQGQAQRPAPTVRINAVGHYYPTAMIMNGDIAGACLRHAPAVMIIDLG